MENLPPVSIYIITYLTSEERCGILKRACEAALAQNYPEFEVVVSENPGPIHAKDALASIRDDRLKIVRNEDNTGFTGNMNRCLDLCSYNIIKPICDDDLVHPDFLINTIPFVDDDTFVIAGYDKYEIGQEPAEMAHRITGPFEVDSRNPGYGSDIWGYTYDPCPSAMLFTKKLYGSLGGYDEKTIISDWDFFVEACMYRKLIYIDRTLCYCGVWPGSLTEEMTVRPFFFPLEGLYTKWRIYHTKNLAANERRWLRTWLWKEFIFQSLRPLCHLFNARYWKGYREYTDRFFKLLKYREDSFTSKPN